ncbi:sugar phosphate isomerase/epimerase family protein [Variovorax sp. PBL-E5]|uniref:sugar phosphate isomerase/epimerase family protein n=1 Tax=Variovorax sp. PBL-E5 TaxID=434014 RepID=UPI0013A568C3|nr:TIM barrel protein [Variovorax sp. PBL-E5]
MVSQLTLGYLTLGPQTLPLELVKAAAVAGYGAVSPRISGRYPGDTWGQAGSHAATFDEFRSAANGARIRIPSVTGYYISPQVHIQHLLANVAAATQLGARRIIQGCFDPDLERVASLLSMYAAAAEDAGVQISLEFMPMSELKTIGQTFELIKAVGASNLGLVIDTLHLMRSGASAVDVARLDPSSIHLTQLSDAPAQLAPGASLFDEAMSGRMHLGEGGLDLASVVRALSADAELELETPVAALASRCATRRACLAAEAAQRFFNSNFPEHQETCP